MTDYTKSTNFASKDSLPQGDPAKIVKGTELDAEFSNIQAANNSKADKASPSFSGTVTIPTAAVTTLRLNGVNVTSSAAELNILDGATVTTAELNKLDGFTGTAADLNYARSLRATGVSVAELDILDGVTATTAELNILDGVTATTSELNVLDGITASTAELNYTDGVTSNIQTQLNTKAPLANPDFTGLVSISGWDIQEISSNLFLTKSGSGDSIILTQGGQIGLGATSFDGPNVTIPISYIGKGNASWFISDVASSKIAVRTYGSPSTTVGNLSFYYNSNVVGGINSTSTSTSFITSSDIRLKDNIRPAPTSGYILDDLDVRSFEWKVDGTSQEYGLVAQEVLAVFPDAVSESEGGLYGVDYSKFVPLLIQEIKDLRRRIAVLEGI